MAKTYIDRMREVRSGVGHAAMPKPKRKSVLKHRRKSRILSGTESKSKLSTRSRSKTRLNMAKSRKRKVRRARDAHGHFLKKKPRSNPRKRTKSKRKHARRHVVRVKRALGRKKSTGRFTRRAKHRVKAHRRTVKGRRVLVRAHSSYEAAAKKRRRARRAREEEEKAMKENPRRRRRRRTGKAKRRHHRAVMENPRKKKRRSPKRRRRAVRRSRRRTATAVMPAVVRRRTRKGGRRISPATVKVVIAGLGRGGKKRRSSKRRSSSKRRKGVSKRKSHRRHSRRGYTPPSHQLTAEAGFFENPLGGYALENPLGGGEILLAAVTGTLGYAMADFLDRYMAVTQFTATPPTGGTAWPSTSPAPTDSQPGVMRILAQAALAAAPLAGAYFVPANHGYAKAALQGIGLGALFHLGGQLITQYLIAPFASGSGPLASLQPYYQNEIQAQTAEQAFLAGLPQSVGRPAGVGNCMSPCGAGDMRGNAAAASLSETTGHTKLAKGRQGNCPPSGVWQGSPGAGPGANAGTNTPAAPTSGSNGTPAPTGGEHHRGSGSNGSTLSGLDSWFPDTSDS
jgi:hypothetical protein